MHLTGTIFLLLWASALAIPLSRSPTEPSSRLSTTTALPSEVKSRPAKMPASVNPYRFTYKAPLSARQLVSASTSKQVAASESTQPQSPKTSDTNNDKNWLLTKAWLIDNINRLRRELGELERDYSQHLNSVERANSQKEKQLIEDITKLRADHTVLSQQQKQIIYLIKKNQVLRSKPVSENDIHYAPSGIIKSSKVADAPIRRQIKRDLSQNYGDTFEAETRRNMKEMFSEMSSLHDITLNMLDGLRSLEHRVDTRDKLFK